jgi:hypothetical protein
MPAKEQTFDSDNNSLVAVQLSVVFDGFLSSLITEQPPKQPLETLRPLLDLDV